MLEPRRESQKVSRELLTPPRETHTARREPQKVPREPLTSRRELLTSRGETLVPGRMRLTPRGEWHASRTRLLIRGNRPPDSSPGGPRTSIPLHKKEVNTVREATALHPHPSTELPEGPQTSTEARLASLVGGAALITLAARDRSWRGIGLALAGAPLVWRGATGNWPAVPRSVVERLPESLSEPMPATVETSVTINRPRQELWAFWRKLENLPRFMRHLESVEELGDGRSRWVGRSPVGLRVEWEAEIVEEREARLLSWRSLPGSRIHNAGSVFFEDATGGRGTVVRVVMEISPGGGLGLGRAVGKVLGPITSQQVHEDLRRFKNLLEAGEIPTTEGQPAGHRSAINIRNPF